MDRTGDMQNVQPHDFIGATLKYLYLTFAESSLMPLDQWVFNTAGQPLPICGRNPAYPNVDFRSRVHDEAAVHDEEPHLSTELPEQTPGLTRTFSRS